eukprot:m51a1_g2212 hypothetical protein (702) ;mRNA; f:197419-204168
MSLDATKSGKAQAAQESRPTSILDLSSSVLASIAGLLDPMDVAQLSLTCRRLSSLLSDHNTSPAMWHSAIDRCLGPWRSALQTLASGPHTSASDAEAAGLVLMPGNVQRLNYVHVRLGDVHEARIVGIDVSGPASLVELSTSVLASIAEHLAPMDIAQLALACRRLSSLLRDRGASPAMWHSSVDRCLSPWRSALQTLAGAAPSDGAAENKVKRKYRLRELLPEGQQHLVQLVQYGMLELPQGAAPVPPEGPFASASAAAAVGLAVMPGNVQRLNYVHRRLGDAHALGHVSSAEISVLTAQLVEEHMPAELHPSKYGGVYQCSGSVLVHVGIADGRHCTTTFINRIGGISVATRGAHEVVLVSSGPTLYALQLAADHLSMKVLWMHTTETQERICAFLAIKDKTFVVTKDGHSVVDIHGHTIHSAKPQDSGCVPTFCGVWWHEYGSITTKCYCACDHSTVVYNLPGYTEDALLVDVQFAFTPFVVVSRETWKVLRIILVESWDDRKEWALHSGLLFIVSLLWAPVGNLLSAISLGTGQCVWSITSGEETSWEVLCGHPSGTLVVKDDVSLVVLEAHTGVPLAAAKEEAVNPSWDPEFAEFERPRCEPMGRALCGIDGLLLWRKWGEQFELCTLSLPGVQLRQLLVVPEAEIECLPAVSDPSITEGDKLFIQRPCIVQGAERRLCWSRTVGHRMIFHWAVFA